MLARRISGSSFAVSWRWLRPLFRVPGAVLADTLLLARLLWAQGRWTQVRRGTVPLRALPLAQQPDDVRGESRQAVAGLMLSLSPGSFVVDSSGQPPTLLVHALRNQPSVIERSVRR